MPISLKTDSPVNVRILEYDDTSLKLRLNGRGQVTLSMFVGSFYPDVRDGVFLNGGINPLDVNIGTPYQVTTGNNMQILADQDGTLHIPLTLDGELEVAIEPAR